MEEEYKEESPLTIVLFTGGTLVFNLLSVWLLITVLQ